MELRHLQAFVAVAEELNFRRAAERLQMAQPPLSQQIKRLERDLGVPLFRRTTRQVVLTSAGEACLVEARNALDAASAMFRVGKQAAQGHLGSVRLGFTGPASYEVLTVVAETFRQHRPGVRLEIGQPAFSGELVEAVRKAEIDIALVRLPLDTTGLAVRTIATGAICVALPQSHALATASRVDLRQLADQPLIDYPSQRGVVFSGAVRAAFVQRGLAPNVVQEAPDTFTLMLLVGAGAGIGFVPMSVSCLAAPGVVLVPVDDLPPTTLGMVWRQDTHNPALRALTDLLDRIAQESEELA
ncbi:LysR family transcriptional regulator [Pseudonocardia sp. C8]|uniref:LysR substrate-binding domain-containing protein n=1 Tax=Pseudonocardia sp. C8 TaxID=2762759 RepID=UPI001642D0CA|nr:LysR substrate-binding domain-containing protein [Pseudonocardia sp. C8]MBC3192969.1 LysR family transcriptional regulator [Pseudonocardia sp. C8]